MLLSQRVWLTRFGGALVIVFGLYLMGVLNLGLLARDTRVHLTDKPVGYLGTVLVGIAFGAGWSPCIGPILGAILTYTASEADLGRGLVLLFAYSMGLAIPFLLAAVAVERFLGFFQKDPQADGVDQPAGRRAAAGGRIAAGHRSVHADRRIPAAVHAGVHPVANLNVAFGGW